MHLIPFPGSSTPYSLSGEASLQNSVLQVVFNLKGMHHQLKKMSSAAHLGPRKNELWKSTCFEWFIKPVQAPYYWECNMSPDGEWNLYKLSDYRKDLIEEISVNHFNFSTKNISDESWQLSCGLDLSKIKDLFKHQNFLLNLSAILETKEGQKTYCSLAHTQKQPDFHHPKHFIIELSKESAL